MQSIGPECTELKRKYDECFNSWFSDHYLKGNKQDICQPLFKEYRACIQRAIDHNKIDVKEIEKSVLGTESEPKFQKSN